jgi:GTP-binding protein HflX
VAVEERFFSTLAPTTRLIKYPERKDIILTDTVGFVEDLPEVLLRAFTATMEELKDATILLHLVDLSSPDFEDRIEIVQKMIKKLDLAEKPVLLVFNKIDKVDDRLTSVIENRYSAVAISCKTKGGIEKLVQTLEMMLASDLQNRRRTPQYEEQSP